MINVTHISTFHLSGGAAVAASRLNGALQANGVHSRLLVARLTEKNVNVYGLDAGLKGKSRFWGRFIMERLFFLPYEQSSDVRFAFSPAISGINITKNRLILEADIIHLHWVNFGLLSIDSIGDLLKLGKPVVWTLHDMWPFTGGCHHSGDCDHYINTCGHCKFLKRPGKSDLSYRRLERKKSLWSSSSSLTAVACSKWLEEKAGNSSLMTRFNVTNIPNPINTDIYKPSDKVKSRIKLNLSPDKDYILFAAVKVSARGKGFAYLKEALKLLVESNRFIKERTELLIIGSSKKDEIDDIPLTAHPLGYVSSEESLVDIYNAASVYVTPSLEENLPNTIMESLSCGTPVVGFRIGGIPEMISHLENGYVSDYKSPESLANGIQWVLEQNSDTRLSKAARVKVLKEYEQTVVAKKYIRLYETILKQK